MQILKTRTFARWARKEAVEDAELRTLKRLAQAYLGMDGEMISRLLDAGELIEVEDGESEVA